MIDTIARGGGAEQLLAVLLPEMRHQGADVEVAILFDTPINLVAELRRDGVTVHELHLRSRYALVDAAQKLRRLVRERRPDIFWGHLYYGNAFAWLARRLAGGGKLVETLHSEGHGEAPPLRVRDRLAVAIERRALKAADRRVAVSAAVRDDFAGYFGLGDIEVAHNAVDCDRLAAAIPADPAAVRARFGYTSDDYVIVTPARYIAKKGHVALIEALRMLRDEQGFKPKALFCGVGPLLDPLRAEVAARGLGDQVTVSPVIPHERLLPLIAAADAFVLPSLREPFGIAAAEAMALGAACVLSDVDGLRELTAGAECALLVPPGDAAELAAAIFRLRSDPDLAAGLGQRAQAHVRARFGIAACAQRWIGILEGPVALVG